jgi:alkylation response protein AidB-like acyl-CoA dehydrogenase
MNFLLTPDQEDLRDGVRSLCAGRFPMDRVREGFDREMWKELAAAGVFTLDEIGMGVAGAAVVFEELGRALVPGPLVWGWLRGRDDVVCGGIDAPGQPVEHFESLDVLLVLEDGVVHEVEARTVDATAIPRPADPLTPLHRIVATPEGESIGDAEEWFRRGAVVTAAYLVGMAAACTDAAVAYAKERQQFDRPIGAFQAVKHMLADMLVRTEVARAATHAAAVTLDDREIGDVDRAVASAKLIAGEAATVNAKTSIQVHGGMGFTWEVNAHLYLKRAWYLDKTFGSGDDHALALAQMVE